MTGPDPLAVCASPGCGQPRRNHWGPAPIAAAVCRGFVPAMTPAAYAAGWRIAGDPSQEDPRDEPCTGSGQLLTLAELLTVAACPTCGGYFRVDPTEAGPALIDHRPAAHVDPNAPTFGL